MSTRAKGAARVLVAASLVFSGVGAIGCQSVDDIDVGEPGTKTVVGGVGGAAAGGLLGAALGDGEAIAAGTLLGGLLGAGVGNVLDQRDRRYMARTTYDALEYAPEGSTRSWSNPESGHSGSVTPVGSYETGGRTCREFRQTVFLDGGDRVVTGTACRLADGTWEIVT